MVDNNFVSYIFLYFFCALIFHLQVHKNAKIWKENEFK